jgi:regulator of CtrA degradation
MSASSEVLEAPSTVAVVFGARLLSSDAFKALFREGMALVEETAAYLDGDGRTESRILERTAALAYATESMRLTTRLMQLASWLLIQRATNEGEMSLEQAKEERAKVKLAKPVRPTSEEVYSQLPERLRDLIERVERLHSRIVYLESQSRRDVAAEPVARPVQDQLSLIRTAFGI